MNDFTLKALKSAEISKDRTSVALQLETDKGPISISMNAVQLEHFATSLEGLEQQLTIINPAAGPASGEAVQMRFYIVDGLQIGSVVANNTPSVAVMVKAGHTSRWYAFNAQHAEALVRTVGDELPSLVRLKGGEQH